ncbi:MAG: LytTR family DNA-binding domain-containing protein [Bacteroidota bacterium]|nr:LytTR family DNA-binding domain-containing protein [Bacteroidota bacterium]
MKKISCAVIDDEPIARDILQDFIGQEERLLLQGNYKNARAALRGTTTDPLPLVSLAINMPGLTGFQFLKSMTNPPPVIFTTAYREHAMEGFDANAIDYLLKPIAIERFLLAVNKAWKFLRPGPAETITALPVWENEDFFFVKADGGLVKIFFHDILFIEALKEYVKIVTKDKAVITYHTISGLEEKLPPGKFYRIHRSFIVNILSINSIEGFTVKIGKMELPISRNERDAFVTLVSSGKIISK